MNNTIDSQHLRVYVTLARTMNMSRAAEELHMTTSGVSHCLKVLEQDLGCRLFDRSSRKFAISQVGREFLAEAEQILDQMKNVRGKIRAWNDWRQGQLLIGANGTACQFLLPPILREFRESFPGFTIKIEQYSSKQAISLLMDEQLDLALLTEPAERAPDIEFNLIGEDDLQFIVNPLHPWAAKRKAQREDIPGRKLILPERGGNTYQLIESYFRSESISIQPFIEIANEQAIKEFVRLDMGVAILPRWMVANEIEQGLLIALPLGRRRLKRHWGVLHTKARKLSLADDLFVSIARSVFRSLADVPEA
ncbi:MAG TPA: LysR family transcriptional regulator [Candidatus Paceibacterota bacterium]|nr:LysR family transcriptional regulator [Candidatus Paceibacterota bacterium]